MLSSILSKLKQFFFPPPNTGLLLDDPAHLAELPHHELFSAGGPSIPNWAMFCPRFRYQGSSYWCTAFAGSSVASIFECKENGKDILFSPLELFYRSNGQVFGNYLINTANAMKDGNVPEEYVPTPTPTYWGVDAYNAYKAISKATLQAEALGKRFAIKSAASVSPDRNSILSALTVSPLMIAIGIGNGYFNEVAPRQTTYTAYHAVVLVGVADDGSYLIFDSLTQKQGFSGFHKLASNYEILSALSFIDLPDNWKETQENATTELNPGPMAHYGKPRVLQTEQENAKKLTELAKANVNIQAYIGRQFLIYVNAVSYGGYSLTDIANYCYSIRRGLKLPFNLNLPRNLQGNS